LYVMIYNIGGSMGSAVPGPAWKSYGWPGVVTMIVSVQVITMLLAWRLWPGRKPAVGAHDLHDHWIRTIQIDENIACVLVSGVRLDVHVASLAVATAQKADDSRMHQLGRRPKSFSRKRTACLVVNQTDQIQLVGHRRELATDALPGQKNSTVVHDRNFAIEAARRTMNSQRTANSVLTVCLTSGGRFKISVCALQNPGVITQRQCFRYSASLWYSLGQDSRNRDVCPLRRSSN
jgi:hypothetical protein